MNITVLMSGDNIHGRIIVDEMVRAGMTPNLIINEEGTKRADRLKKFGDNEFDNPKSVKTIDTEYIEVEQFDSPKTLDYIKNANTDYLIIAGCGAIIRKNILSITTPINIHPGILPQFRGLDPVLWAVDKKAPVGATVHIMDEGIDTGDILICEEMPWQNAQSILELRIQCIRWGAKLLTAFLKNPSQYKSHKQDEEEASYFSAFPKDKYVALENKLPAYQEQYQQSQNNKDEKMTPSYFMTGEKVGLRMMTREDLPIYQKWLNDKEVTKYLEMGWRGYTERDLNNVYDESDKDPLSIIYVICDLKTHEPIGTTGFYFIHWPGRRAQFRILIGEPDYHGCGFGSEVNKIMVQYGFDRLNLHTLYLGVNAENKGAIRSYEKAGYVHEGVHRDFVYNHGRYYDSISMSILSTDYYKDK